MLALNHCQFNVDVSVDVNKLVDQAVAHLEVTEAPDLRNKVQDTKGDHTPARADTSGDSADSKSPEIEHSTAPSKRRGNVNKERRVALRRRREQFPRRKSRS